MAYERRLNIDREALYRGVWAEPVTVVAKRYGISARVLCRVEGAG